MQMPLSWRNVRTGVVIRVNNHGAQEIRERGPLVMLPFEDKTEKMLRLRVNGDVEIGVG